MPSRPPSSGARGEETEQARAEQPECSWKRYRSGNDVPDIVVVVVVRASAVVIEREQHLVVAVAVAQLGPVRQLR